MSRFTQALLVSPLSDGKTWVIMRPFGYEIGQEGSGRTVECPVGFMTDFASIPRIFWVILPVWGKYGNAAVIHDWLYWDQDRSRREADHILFEAMGVLAVPAWQMYAIFWAVRGFGWFAWKRNRMDRAAGFNRVIQPEGLKSVQESPRPGLLHRFAKHYAKKIQSNVLGSRP